MKISIGLTTRNRYETFKKTYDSIKRFMPPNCSLFVVDDNSENPVKEAAFRFEENVGIARSKNKALELMGDVDYYFIFDDDCYPIADNWWIPYIESGFNHLSFTFDRTVSGINGNRLLSKRNGYNIFQNACGCMLFYTRKCLETVGGMDERFGIWGYEHISLSQRIHNAGLTPYPFMDVSNSLSLFYSHDYHETCDRSVSAKVRTQEIKRNTPLYNASKKSKEFIPYKEMKGRIITTYFTGVEDPQRGENWEKDLSKIMPLQNTIAKKCELTVLTDAIKLPWSAWENDETDFKISMIPTECKINPYLQRWISILEYLKEVKEDYVFCVDATDVLMLNNPFETNLGNYLWVGDEPSTINNAWLHKHHNTPMLNDFYRKYRSRTLLNAGLLGGRKIIVEQFLKRLVWHIENSETGMSDMGLFNYVLYTEFQDKIRHGRMVSTVFKSYQTTGSSFFAHK